MGVFEAMDHQVDLELCGGISSRLFAVTMAGK